ncbi:ketopantoate reductase family protein [Ureibacillus sp. MALMAid1270]|uniref:ketopantoate reductase family protein n=1 Tax=Ureibacillus sp. MALMAid1270 TaxID=3411629 RepID=UPI003BA40A71
MKLLYEVDTNMAQDIEAKRFSEVELFLGTVLKYAEKHGLEAPVNKMLYEKIISKECEYVRYKMAITLSNEEIVIILNNKRLIPIRINLSKYIFLFARSSTS